MLLSINLNDRVECMGYRRFCIIHPGNEIYFLSNISRKRRINSSLPIFGITKLVWKVLKNIIITVNLFHINGSNAANSWLWPDDPGYNVSPICFCIPLVGERENPGLGITCENCYLRWSRSIVRSFIDPWWLCVDEGLGHGRDRYQRCCARQTNRFLDECSSGWHRGGFSKSEVRSSEGIEQGFPQS